MRVAPLSLVGGCAGPLSVLDPAGPSARAIAAVWWWMFGVACAVLVGVVLLWWLGMRRKRAAAEPGEDDRGDARGGNAWIVGGGVLLPGTAIAALLVFGSPAGWHQLPLARTTGPATLPVHVTAHRWGWEFHHGGTQVRTRNELHIPAGQPIDFHVTSRDVIHSFWVPRLGGKLDAIPGHVNVVRLQADAPGSYAGRCAEYCGIGHAAMHFVVHALEPAAFEQWLQAQHGAAGNAPP